MLFAIRTIQERTGKDLGATFLSGTTISNSLTELFLLFKYLRPKEMERQQIKTFDAWAAVYAKKPRLRILCNQRDCSEERFVILSKFGTGGFLQ